MPEMDYGLNSSQDLLIQDGGKFLSEVADLNNIQVKSWHRNVAINSSF